MAGWLYRGDGAVLRHAVVCSGDVRDGTAGRFRRNDPRELGVVVGESHVGGIAVGGSI